MRRSCFTLSLCGMTLGAVVLALGVIALAGGCATRHLAKPSPEYPPECRFSPVASSAGAQSNGASDEAAPITFALFEPVDLARAPWAGNASERILFNHLYETLTTIDCTAELRPALAESWTSEERGRVWTFDLAREARFWDGSPIAARDVAASWSDALTLPTGIDSVRALDDRRLRVWLRAPEHDVPRLLSASFFAVTKTAGGSRWLMGTGPYRIGGVDATAFPSARRVIALYPALNNDAPSIRFVQASAASASEARDLLERGVDVMVTADPAVIEYALDETRFACAALPWEKTYVLVSPSRALALARGLPAPMIPFDARDALARDAVRSDARAWEAPSWWEVLEGCDYPASVAASEASSGGRGHAEFSAVRPAWDDRRIVYEENDPAARDLAERIAALTMADTARSAETRAFARSVPGFSGGQSAARAEGVTPREFARSLQRGEDFAYIITMPRETCDPCEEVRGLATSAPWLLSNGHGPAGRGDDAGGGFETRGGDDAREIHRGLNFSRAIIPLVDTRSHAIVRRGRASLWIDGWGGVRIVSPLDGGSGR